MKKALLLMMAFMRVFTVTTVFAGGQKEKAPAPAPVKKAMAGAEPTSFTKLEVEKGATIVFSG